MQAFLLGSPSSVDGGGGFSVGSKGSFSLVSWVSHHRRNWPSGRRTSSIVATAAINGEQDHYAVLGLSSSASCADIKRAYRLLARKYHPDVSKDSKAGEVFKSIRLAYDVLSDEAARVQYDHKLKFQDDNGRPWRGNWTGEPDFDDGIRIYRWAKLRRRMQEEKYWKEYETDEMEEEEEEETTNVEREPFSEVLKSAFFTLFFTQTLGYRLSLTLCSLSALFDKKLDAGYKMGYIIAWILGGRGGILLTLCLSFGSWLCGKTSSSLVALVVMAMWVGANLARYVPLPQGALLTLLYMSVKLQVDLS